MKRVEFIGCCLLLLVMGCTAGDDELPKEKDNKMKILSVDVPEKKISRAETTTINKVRIYVAKSDNTAYSSGSKGDVYEYKNGQWQVANPLILTSTVGSVYGCWPDNEVITPSADAMIGTIPVSVLTEDKFTAGLQTDYLYATPVTGVSSSNKAIGLTMKHALSKVSFRVEKAQAAESDAIILEKMEIISGTNRLQAGSGSMQLATGDLVGLTDRNIFTLKGNMSLAFPQATPNITCLVAPMSASESVLSFRLTVQATGTERVFETQVLPTAQFWQAGNHYVYHILVNKIGVTLNGVVINKWGSDANQDTSIGI